MMVRVWKHNAERKRLQRETGKFVAPSFKVALTPTKNEQRAGFGAKYPNLEEFEYASFWLFGRGHPIRRLCYSVVTNRSFDHAIFFLICVSSVAMAMESPEVIDRGGAMLDALNVLDRVLTSTFIVELVLKVTAYSMVGEPGAYSSDPWNLLDFFIVLVSIVDWSLSDDSLGWVKVIRIFRVLRPLRMINRVPELKTVVNALIASFPGMGNVLIVSFLFWLIFGILGMSLFMGLFRYCSDETVSGKADCIGTYDAGQGVMEERRWLDKEANFNNIYKAMMTLFEMSTTEGWLEVLYSAADVTGRDRQPRRNANEIAVPYFILFMVIGSFFLVNLFVGIILDNFAALREKGGNAHLFASERQREWVSAREKLSKNKPAPSYEAVAKIPGPRGVALRIARHPWFEYGIMLVVMLNTVFLATASADQTEVHDGVLMYANLVFTVIYIAEAALKMYAANGMRKYFKDAWNVFDFSIVIVGVVGIFIDIGGASLIRIFRVVRVLRLIRSMKSLRVLFETLFLSSSASSSDADVRASPLPSGRLPRFGRSKKDCTCDRSTMRCSRAYLTYVWVDLPTSWSCIASSRWSSRISLSSLRISTSGSMRTLRTAWLWIRPMRFTKRNVESVSSMCCASPHTFAMTVVRQFPPRLSSSMCVSLLLR